MKYIEFLKQNPKCNIVILTGAGISAESGLKTFRDNNGLWENHRVEEVATPEAFAANPSLVYKFYNQRRAQLLSGEVKPNEAHYALGELENSLGRRSWIITQNVDNLHERGGAKNVIHMHGELASAKCPNSNSNQSWLEDLSAINLCDCCEPKSSLRPDIVWFGEIPYHMEQIETLLSDANLFVSIGTSGNVYPAAGFVNFANQMNAFTLELNLEPSLGKSQFDESIHGPASEVVPEFVENCLRYTER